MDEKYHMDDIEYASRILNHREDLSDEEVNSWLESHSHRALLGEMARLKHVLGNKDFNNLRQSEWKRLSTRIRDTRLRRRVIWAASVAAVVVCLLGWNIMLQWRKMDIPSSEMANQTEKILPGSQKAELILAGGERIVLGQASASIETPEFTGITDDSIKGLDYSRVSVLKEAVQSRYNILRVPVGGFYKLSLPDGSEVWLNSASELRFPVQFNGEKREVYLEGEGFFQVARDTSKQFIVHLNKAQISVLGTKFNVNAYQDEERIYTTLAEGSITFRSSKGENEVYLHPGEQSIMDMNNGETTVLKVDPSIYSAWIKGRFVFRAMDLGTIMRQLQRWYDCEVFYTSEEIKQQEFWGVINRDMELMDVLNIIEETAGVHFEIKGRTVIVSKA